MGGGGSGGNGFPPFESVDTDKDGKVSYEEMQKAMMASGDNTTSEDPKTMFDIMDRDPKDGFLSKTEFAAFGGGEGGCDQEAIEQCTEKINPMLMM
jgi:hypothetical protein